MAAQGIATGQSEVAIAGGTESMSLIPMGGHKISPNPGLLDRYPDSYLGMGVTAELVAKKYGITREKADAFSLESHRRAVAAIEAGRFKDEIVPLKVGGAVFDTDEGPRKDTTAEALAKLKPAFASDGIVTAGNSSQMSDGAAAAVVMTAERAQALGIKPLARLVAFAVAGVPPEIMGIGPVEAIPRALKQAGLTLADIDVIELNEAFAAQALAVIETLGLDPAKVNVNGGAVALGHPLGATGAKLTAQIIAELNRRQGRYGLVSMCVGGGMGAAGIFERL
jgi:acetyl-CoA acyltransferase